MRSTVTRVNQRGIPVLKTQSVIANTTNVIYSVCPFNWKQLECSGLMVLKINNAAPTGSDALLVSINTGCTEIALLNGLGEQVTSADVVLNSRLLVFFNKCEGVLQLVNYIPAG